jgi:hypothetical protein
MALAGGGTALHLSDPASQLRGPDDAGFNIEVREGCRVPTNDLGFDSNSYRWTLRLTGFKAGQYIYFHQKDYCLSGSTVLSSLSRYMITEAHAVGGDMVIQELASVFDASKLHEYHFRY